MADQGNNTSSSSEYSDDRAARPAPGIDKYFNEKVYCSCKRCQNRKLKKRRIVHKHRLNYGVYIEEKLPVHNIAEERMDASDDSHSRHEVQYTFMDETNSHINEAGIDEFSQDLYTSSEELIDSPLAHLAKTPLFAHAELTSDEQIKEINKKVTHVPIGASTSTPKTTTISLVTTKGTREVTILLSSEGDVLKDEMGMKFFHFIYRRAEHLFGNTIQIDWRKQAIAKKEELFKDVITTFGNPGFNKEYIIDIARKYIHSKRDNLRSKLSKDLRYPCPVWITDQITWDELMKDAEFKMNTPNNTNLEGSKKRLRDTTKATQARVLSIGSHKLGSGGYNSIRGDLVHQFQKEASEEDLKFASLHGSQSLRQHILDQGEKLVTCHEYEGTRET